MAIHLDPKGLEISCDLDDEFEIKDHNKRFPRKCNEYKTLNFHVDDVNRRFRNNREPVRSFDDGCNFVTPTLNLHKRARNHTCHKRSSAESISTVLRKFERSITRSNNLVKKNCDRDHLFSRDLKKYDEAMDKHYMECYNSLEDMKPKAYQSKGRGKCSLEDLKPKTYHCKGHRKCSLEDFKTKSYHSKGHKKYSLEDMKPKPYYSKSRGKCSMEDIKPKPYQSKGRGKWRSPSIEKLCHSDEEVEIGSKRRKTLEKVNKWKSEVEKMKIEEDLKAIEDEKNKIDEINKRKQARIQARSKREKEKQELAERNEQCSKRDRSKVDMDSVKKYAHELVENDRNKAQLELAKRKYLKNNASNHTEESTNRQKRSEDRHQKRSKDKLKNCASNHTEKSADGHKRYKNRQKRSKETFEPTRKRLEDIHEVESKNRHQRRCKNRQTITEVSRLDDVQEDDGKRDVKQKARSSKTKSETSRQEHLRDPKVRTEVHEEKQQSHRGRQAYSQNAEHPGEPTNLSRLAQPLKKLQERIMSSMYGDGVVSPADNSRPPLSSTIKSMTNSLVSGIKQISTYIPEVKLVRKCSFCSCSSCLTPPPRSNCPTHHSYHCFSDRTFTPTESTYQYPYPCVQEGSISEIPWPNDTKYHNYFIICEPKCLPKVLNVLNDPNRTPTNAHRKPRIDYPVGKSSIDYPIGVQKSHSLAVVNNLPALPASPFSHQGKDNGPFVHHGHYPPTEKEHHHTCLSTGIQKDTWPKSLGKPDSGKRVRIAENQQCYDVQQQCPNPWQQSTLDSGTRNQFGRDERCVGSKTRDVHSVKHGCNEKHIPSRAENDGSFKPNARSFEPNARSFEPNARNVEPNARNVEPNARNVEPNARSFEPNSKSVAPNDRSFKPNPRNFEPNARSFEPNPRSFEPNRCRVPMNQYHSYSNQSARSAEGQDRPGCSGYQRGRRTNGQQETHPTVYRSVPEGYSTEKFSMDLI